MYPVDRTVSLGERASELMRAYSRSACPRSYEVWYTYVSGVNPELNDRVKRLISAQDRLSADDIEAIHDAHLAKERLASQAEKTGSGLLVEMQQVLSLIESALGSTARYGASLETLTGQLTGPLERNRMRDIVEALIGATRDVASSNNALEIRLRESRGEIEALRNLLDEVRIESLTDPLTGIANRKHFEAVLMSSVASAQADGSSLMLIVIDIDQFKRFNDVYGHLTGDQVLRLVGSAMREHVGQTSTLARFGGEEFGIILPAASAQDAFSCAEEIRRNVMSRELLKRSTGESLGRVTISLGIAALRPGDDATSLLERADQCMYRAKRSGRNRTVAESELAVAEEPLPSAA